jgi:hypothetical protein
MGSQVGGSADAIAAAYKMRRLNNLSRTSKNSRDKSNHQRSMSDLKIEPNRITLDKKELDKRLVSKKIDASNPYVSRKEKLEQGPTEDLSLSFNGVKVGHNSKAVTDP